MESILQDILTSGLPFQEQTIGRLGRDVFAQVLGETPKSFPSRCELAAELHSAREPWQLFSTRFVASSRAG